MRLKFETACPDHQAGESAVKCLFHKKMAQVYFYLFYLYIYPSDLQKSDGGANT